MIQLNLPKKNFSKIPSNIKKMVTKIRYLFGVYRGKYKTNEDSLIGIFDIIDGLEYHYQNISKVEKRNQKLLDEIFLQGPKGFYVLSPEEQDKILLENRRIFAEEWGNLSDSANIKHELTAYLNRMGQLYYFVQSPWVHNLVCSKECIYKNNKTQKISIKKRAKLNCKMNELIAGMKNLLALLPVRHKFTAHRSVDNTNPSDLNKKWTSLVGMNKNGFPRIALISKDSIVKNTWFTFNFCKEDRNEFLDKNPVEGIERFEGNKLQITFDVTYLHEKIIDEFFTFLEKALKTKN